MPPVDSLSEWIGREEVCAGDVALTTLRCMHALMDRPEPAPAVGDPMPRGWHWLWMFSLTPAPQSQIDVDGHPRRGGFLPPVPLPRRMWAGSRVTYTAAPLRVGQPFERRSRIADVQVKQGRSGTMVFVTVEHAWSGPDGQAIVEAQDIVYREAAQPGAPSSPMVRPEQEASVRHTIEPSSSWLFRYSALTFNAHRIHYDRPYAREVEGYPGLVVHGPLQATLLQELLARERPQRDLARFEFRGRSPACDTGPLAVCAGDLDGAEVALWTESAEGSLATQAVAAWR